jgi:hypothetical protein
MFVYVTDVAVRWFGLGWTSFRANGWNLFDIVVAGGSFVTTLMVRFGSSGFALDQLQKLFLVSIAFKLVQKNNSLNMLFKTAVYVSSLNCSLCDVLTLFQGELTSNIESAWAMARTVYILCNTKRRGVQHDQMGFGGEQEPELFVHGFCHCDAVFHECRVWSTSA